MTNPRLTAAALVAVTGCAMSLNGKPTGYGSSGSSGSSATSTPTSGTGSSGQYGTYESMGQTGTYPEAERTSETARYDSLPAYLSAPADPWAGVDGDQPRRWSDDDARYWKVRANDGDCSAAHDHCLVKDAWFIEPDAHRATPIRRYASLHVFGPEGPVNPVNARSAGSWGEEKYTAYRTVPGTRANLQPGATVVVLSDAKLPATGRDAVERSWIVGTLDRVNYDIDKLYITGREDSEWISAARVAVITWRPGETVKIVGDAKRDQLAVSVKDVILPPASE